MAQTITVKFHSDRMLLTVDLQQLFKSLFETFGDCHICFVPMSASEIETAIESIDGFDFVRERFWILRDVAGERVREEALEEEVVRRGHK